MKKLIGVRSDFHTQTCFNLYMYAVSLARQINAYIDNGYVVMKGEERINKFVFMCRMADAPCIGVLDGKYFWTWYGSTMSDEGKVCLREEVTKKQIRDDFRALRIYDPSKFVKLKI